MQITEQSPAASRAGREAVWERHDGEEVNAVKQKSIPLLDLQAQHRQVREEVLAEVVRVIDSQQFIMGEDVRDLEREIAAYSNARFAVGCASGSDALLLALLGVGIQPGDEVLTTPYTFFATVSAISRAGATPVFVDVEAGTFNMDMIQAADALARRPAIKAVIPIHLFGGCADLDPLCALGRERGIAVIEDAAQSIGSEYKGRRAGSIGDVGCFSFYPTKNLGGYGDGGMLTTSDAALGGDRRCCGFTAADASIITIGWGSTPGWIPCRQPCCG